MPGMTVRAPRTHREALPTGDRRSRRGDGTVMCRETGDGQGHVVVGEDQPALRRSAMSTITVRALRAAVVVPLLAASALMASVGHASATINTDNTDRPKISA